MTRSMKDYSAARQYLAKVLPWPPADGPPAWIGIHYKHWDAAKKKFFWRSRGVVSVKEAVSTIDWLMSLKDTSDIYVCMGSLKSGEQKTAKSGRSTYVIVKREQEHVTGLKSFYMDLDAKGVDNDSYDSLKDAMSALFEFLKAIRFPAPSVVVRTGGGVHVYWTLDRLLTPAEWLPLAQALVSAAQQNGLKFDTGCSVDYARVLRIPCTLNHKFTPPKEVKLVSIEDGDYSVARIEQALNPYKGVVRSIAPGKSHIADPKLFGVKLPLTSESDLSAGVEAIELPKPTLKQLMKACPYVRDTVRTGGKGQPEPLWYNGAVSLAQWTVEGKAAAQVMSMGDPRWDRKDTSDKYEQAVDAQASKGLGWPQCATIAGHGSVPCKTCKHLSQGKSPLNFTALPPIAVTNPLITGLHSTVVSGNDLPSGFRRSQIGYVEQEHQNDDGTIHWVPICDYVMLNPWINETDKSPTLHFTTSTRVGVLKTVSVQLSLISSNEMRKELGMLGLVLSGRQLKPMGEFLVAWVKKLQAIKEAVTTTEPFGWDVENSSLEGFAYAGQLYTPKGARIAPNADSALAKNYMPIGSMTPFMQAIRLVHSQDRMPLDAIIAASFGAPLIRFTGQPGVLMSAYSTESGIFKSTAMQVAQAVWGDPVKAMQGLDDTQNSVLNKLGKLRHLPLFWDELKTAKDAEKMVNTLFTLSRGREKERLNSRIEMREMGTWETILISASNESMLDVVLNRTRMTTAGINRLFEYVVHPGQTGRIAVSDASRITAALKSNFGLPGQAYSQFLGANFTAIDKEVGEKLLEIGRLVTIEPDERFWTALIACVVLGAKYANELGLAEFNSRKLERFMIQQFVNMRKLRREQPIDITNPDNVSTVLVEFLRDKRARNTLVTETMWMGRGKPTNSISVIERPLDAMVVHVALKDRRMRISMSGLQVWLERSTYPRHTFIDQLRRMFGAKMLNSRLGVGTGLASGTEKVLDIDLSHTVAQKYLGNLA